MSLIYNLVGAAYIYTYCPIDRCCYNIVNGKYKPTNEYWLSYALDTYENINCNWGFMTGSWSQHIFNNAFIHNIIQYRNLFEKYPITDWDVSKIKDNILLEKWKNLCENAKKKKENGINEIGGWIETRTRYYLNKDVNKDANINITQKYIAEIY